jgi:hypothetical protein
MSVQNGLTNVQIMPVSELYAEYDRMDVPDYYEDGEVNPYAGRIKVVPRKASFYTMIPAMDETALALARALLKGVGKRRKVREAICTKGECNFNMFAKAGKIVVLYV